MALQIKKYNLDGKEVGVAELDEKMGGSVANLQMIKDYLVAMRTNQRQWSAHTKTRAEVSHSGQKPHAQKGSGKARQGYLGAPQYKGGGRVHTPRAKVDQHIRINKKERRAAIRHLISEKIREGHICILQEPVMESPKTKRVDAFLKSQQWSGKRVLFLADVSGGSLEDRFGSFMKSLRNIPRVSMLPFPQMSGYEAIVNEKIVIFESALDDLTLLFKD